MTYGRSKGLYSIERGITHIPKPRNTHFIQKNASLAVVEVQVATIINCWRNRTRGHVSQFRRPYLVGCLRPARRKGQWSPNRVHHPSKNNLETPPGLARDCTGTGVEHVSNRMGQGGYSVIDICILMSTPRLPATHSPKKCLFHPARHPSCHP